jgi:hypothetical protein
MVGAILLFLNSCARARMVHVIGPSQISGRYVRIDLRGRNVAVAQKGLHVFYLGAVLQ